VGKYSDGAVLGAKLKLSLVLVYDVFHVVYSSHPPHTCNISGVSEEGRGRHSFGATWGAKEEASQFSGMMRCVRVHQEPPAFYNISSLLALSDGIYIVQNLSASFSKPNLVFIFKFYNK
jgi:hypothetical protein